MTNIERQAGRCGPLKVLIQNRPNTLTQRGGDTVLIERLTEGLRARGVDVTLDFEGTARPADFDIVHLFNFVLPEMTRRFAEKAKAAGVPFVVTTLNEDAPTFLNQSTIVAQALMEYVARGQDKVWWESARRGLSSVSPSGWFDNTWTAENAARLFTNGARESASIRKMYPRSAPIAEIRLGHEVSRGGDAEMFAREYGVRDFILCVGRIESRKNQLMLLKAFERSELPIVLAGGGFSYQPDYDRAVRAFKRAGKTVILDRISPEMLASAYAAAKVHVLPSWYELPGLVSLEAANYNCNVVVTDNGTAWDYLGERAFYCEPGDERSIVNAVTAAYYAPLVPGLREVARSATWDSMVTETLSQYEMIVPKRVQATNGSRQNAMEVGMTQVQTQGTTSVPQSSTGASPAPESPLQEALENGERAARNHEYHLAHEHLARAEAIAPTSVRALRARGAVFLAEGKIPEAEGYFTRAMSLNEHDPKTLSGMAMCAMQRKMPATAYDHLVKALDVAPDQLVAMLQLIECSYALERFADLERALRRYTTLHPEDVDMTYCLAGCLFKLQRLADARALVDKVLSTKPDHAGAQQLLDFIAKAQAEAPLATRIETEITGPSRTVRPGTGVSGVEESADGAIGAIEELKQRGEFEALKKSCVELLERSGLSPEQTERATVLRAEGEILTGNFAVGTQLYDQVLVRNPHSSRALSGKGALAAHEGDWIGAREYFERALATNPSFDVALAGMGMCSMQHGDTEQAWSFFVRATKSNPENTRAILGLIELGYPQRRFGEIETALNAYLELHPADLDFVYSLAGCLYLQGKHIEALDAVSRIELFEPANERARELRRTIEGQPATGITQPS